MNTKIILLLIANAVLASGIGYKMGSRYSKADVADRFDAEIKEQCLEYVEVQLLQSNAEAQLGVEGYASYKAALSAQCEETAITLRAVLEDVLYGGEK